jgi:hypothetical protein
VPGGQAAQRSRARQHGPIGRIGIAAGRRDPWGMTARWSDPHRLPGPIACCDPGYARAVTVPR